MKKVLALTMALALVAASFAGCGNSSSGTSTTAAATTAAAGETAAEGTGTVKIGMSGPLTGGASAYGLAVKAGMEVAVEEINAKGGLQIEFNAQDDEADGEKAVSAYNVLKDWGMQVMAGQVTTGSALAVAPESAADNMFNLTPSASAEALATTGDNIFQMCFTDPNQGASAAELVSTKYTGSKVGIIYDSSDDYSTGLYSSFVAECADLGINIVETQTFTASTSTDFSTQVNALVDSGVKVVFIPFYAEEASTFLTQAKGKFADDVYFFGADGLDGILGKVEQDVTIANNVLMLTPFAADSTEENVQSFVKAYEAAYGATPDQFAADAYDAVYVIKAAVEKAGSTSGAALAAVMPELEVTGVTGTMTWDADGNTNKNASAILYFDGVGSVFGN